MTLGAAWEWVTQDVIQGCRVEGAVPELLCIPKEWWPFHLGSKCNFSWGLGICFSQVSPRQSWHLNSDCIVAPLTTWPVGLLINRSKKEIQVLLARDALCVQQHLTSCTPSDKQKGVITTDDAPSSWPLDIKFPQEDLFLSQVILQHLYVLELLGTLHKTWTAISLTPFPKFLALNTLTGIRKLHFLYKFLC